jgi:predicted Mrr-cat superfamily restriction endonuclease
MKYWRIGTRPRDRSDDWWSPMRRGHFVAIGFTLGADLNTLLRAPGLTERIRSKHPGADPEYIATTLRQFVFAVGKGDIVVAADGTRVLGIGEIVGEYEYVDRADGAPPDRRRVIWRHLDVWEAPVWAGRSFPEGYRRTLFQLREPATLHAVNQRLGRSRAA